MNHAAFGTGFYRYRDWETRDGEMWDFYIKGSGFQGDISASRPPGGAVWEGRMVGYQSGLEEDPFVQGNARVRLSFARDRVSVGFSGQHGPRTLIGEVRLRRWPCEGGVFRRMRRSPACSTRTTTM